MTETDLEAIVGMIRDYVSTPRLSSEIVDHLEDMGVDHTVASNVVPWAAGRGIIAIAPGTCGKRWTTKAAARKAMQEED